MSFDGGERLEAVSGLPDDFDIAQLVKLIAQLFSRQLFVVYDENSHAAPDGVRPLHTFSHGV
jgi:hypothetical protein